LCSTRPTHELGGRRQFLPPLHRATLLESRHGNLDQALFDIQMSQPLLEDVWNRGPVGNRCPINTQRLKKRIGQLSFAVTR